MDTPARGHTDTASELRQPRSDCKSVLIATDVFDWLRAIQMRTNSPRLELRYLIEAAVDMVKEDPEMATRLERQARTRLQRHLNSIP